MGNRDGDVFLGLLLKSFWKHNKYHFVPYHWAIQSLTYIPKKTETKMGTSCLVSSISLQPCSKDPDFVHKCKDIFQRSNDISFGTLGVFHVYCWESWRSIPDRNSSFNSERNSFSSSSVLMTNSKYITFLCVNIIIYLYLIEI